MLLRQAVLIFRDILELHDPTHTTANMSAELCIEFIASNWLVFTLGVA
jgi:hypothetical protein